MLWLYSAILEEQQYNTGGGRGDRFRIPTTPILMVTSAFQDEGVFNSISVCWPKQERGSVSRKHRVGILGSSS